MVQQGVSSERRGIRMKKILDGAGGFFRSRVLWALVGFGLVIYVSELLF